MTLYVVDIKIIIRYKVCMYKLLKIYDIATITSGYTFREAISVARGSGTSVVQAKNIRKDDLRIDGNLLVRVEDEEYRTNAYIQKDDVVIGARGVFRAGVIRFAHKALAASSVYILRIVDQKQMLPEYLAVFLNSSFGQKQLTQRLTTGTIKSLRKNDLAEIILPLLPIDQQKNIVNLYQNIEQQSALLHKKLDVYKNLSTGVFNLIEKEKSYER